MKQNDVVQFTENHAWRGCLGIIDEIRSGRILIGVPVPGSGSDGSAMAYIFAKETDFEVVGKAALVPGEEKEA